MSPAQQHAFEQFWANYPRKVGKLAAAREWERHHPELDAVLMALDWQRLGWSDPRYIPHPRTYLSQGRWLDEPDTRPVARERWQDECRRLHSSTCNSPDWHLVLMARQADEGAS